MKKRIKDVGVFIAIFMLHTVACSTNAQGFISSAQLESLFLQAVQADGGDYIKLRENILSKPGVESFLKEKVNCTNLMERVLGRAMLSWSHNGVANAYQSEYLRTAVVAMSKNILGKRSVLDNLHTAKTHPHWFKEKVDVPIMLEVALKGPFVSTENGPGEKSQNDFFVKCFAAGLAGMYDDPNVVPVLTVLVGENEEDFMRLSALTGLTDRRDTKSELFLEGLSDRNRDYRNISYYELRRVTGHDFGLNPERYRIWLETNAVKQVSGY